MFYGVDPTVHGVINNDCIKDSNLGNGITETLAAAGRTSAMFYDWKKLETLTTLDSVSKTYINGDPGTSGKEWFEESTVALTDAVIKHVEETPTDFTFLYYALTDEMGHTYNWMSDKYEWGVEHVFDNLERVLDALSEEYVVIITADHGGHDQTHGTEMPEDMTIPVLFCGERFEKNAQLTGVSIKDIAPTVLKLFDLDIPRVWEGKALL